MKVSEALGWLSQNRINIGQDREEITWLFDRVKKVQAGTMVEIGSREGGSLYVLAHALKFGSRIISVELPERRWGHRGSEEQLLKVISQLKREGYKPILVKADSKDPSTVEVVRELMFGPIDFLFIDGDHTIKAVTADYINYSPLVREGGLIAFHDIKPDSRRFRWGTIDVPELWEEIKANYIRKQKPYDEILEWAGIGVITV